jgi:hypothetical protein
MEKQLSILRIALGLLASLFLWLVWQSSAVVIPEFESREFNDFLSKLPPVFLYFFKPWSDEIIRSCVGNGALGDFLCAIRKNDWWFLGRDNLTDAQYLKTWIGFLPTFCLLGVSFSVLKPICAFCLLVAGMLRHCDYRVLLQNSLQLHPTGERTFFDPLCILWNRLADLS